MRLPPPIADSIKGNKQFLELSHLSFNDIPLPTTYYLVVGYPNFGFEIECSPNRLVTTDYIWGGLPYSGDPKVFERFEPQLNVTINYQKGINLATGKDSKSLPDAYGLSGCGIWRAVMNLKEKHDFSCNDLRLVATQHTVSNVAKALIGSQIRCAALAIHRHFPALRKVIQRALASED